MVRIQFKRGSTSGTTPGSSQVVHPKSSACPICKKRFVNKYYKEAHVIVVHKNAGRFKCRHCGKTSESRSNSKIHERSHTKKKKKFTCETCGKRYQMRFHLEKHLQSHSSKRFDQCGDSFQHQQSLKVHQTRDHSATQRETPGRRCSIRGKDQKREVKVKQSNGSNGSGGATYSLRSGSKTPNYREYEDDVKSDEESEDRSSGNEADMSAAYVSPDRAPSPIILLSPDKSSLDSVSSPKLKVESDSVCSPNMKVVFGVEYRAPE